MVTLKRWCVFVIILSKKWIQNKFINALLLTTKNSFSFFLRWRRRVGCWKGRGSMRCSPSRLCTASVWCRRRQSLLWTTMPSFSTFVWWVLFCYFDPVGRSLCSDFLSPSLSRRLLPLWNNLPSPLMKSSLACHSRGIFFPIFCKFFFQNIHILFLQMYGVPDWAAVGYGESDGPICGWRHLLLLGRRPAASPSLQRLECGVTMISFYIVSGKEEGNSKFIL